MDKLEAPPVIATPQDTTERGLGVSDFLSADKSPRELQKDLRLLEASAKRGWDCGPKKRRAAIARLNAIIQKGTVDIPTKFGEFASAAVADQNAIAAARVLGTLDQRERLGANADARPINVNVAVQTDIQAAVGTEAEYLRWLRERELGKSGDTAAVGENCFTAEIYGPAAHSGD